MKYTSLLAIMLCILASSCSKPEPDILTQNITNNPLTGALILDDLQIGDEFYYELFSAEDYFDEDNPNYTILADTLVLEVCGITDDGKFVISEQLTEGSAIFDSDDIYYYGADSVYTNFWVIQNDSLFFEPKGTDNVASHLFWGTPPTFNLLNFTENETTINGWKIDLITSEFNETYFVSNGVIGNNTYEHINVVVNNGGMAVDGPGFMYFYNRDDGFLRTSTYSAWTGAGQGWERIAE